MCPVGHLSITGLQEHVGYLLDAHLVTLHVFINLYQFVLFFGLPLHDCLGYVHQLVPPTVEYFKMCHSHFLFLSLVQRAVGQLEGLRTD